MKKLGMKKAVFKQWFSARALLLLVAVAFAFLLFQAGSVSSAVLAGKTVQGNVALWSVSGVGTVETPAKVLGGGVAEIKYSNATLPATIDYGVYFHEPGFSPVSFKVRRNITEPVYESVTTCVNVSKRSDFNNTDYNETNCTYESVQSGSVTYEADVSLPVQYLRVQDSVYSYVTAGASETVKVEMPMLIGDKSVEYSVIAKPTSESWAGNKVIEVDPQLNGVYFRNSSNFSIKINAPSTVTMPAWYPVYSINITGIPEKNANSSDVRLVDTSTGNLVCFDILSNTSNSVEIVPLINFTSPSENHTMVFYWGNSSVGTYDNSCPNDLNWQAGTTQMVSPKVSAVWTFSGSAINSLNCSGLTGVATGAIKDAIDDGTNTIITGSGTASLVFNGNVVKIINGSNGGKSALYRFFAFNNFTRITYHGFTATQNDAFYGTYGTPMGTNTIYYRNSGGDFGSISGVSDAQSNFYGMIAAGTNTNAWSQYLFLNATLQSTYTNGNVMHSYTRANDVADPQAFVPATAWGSGYPLYLGNFTFYAGVTTVDQNSLNTTFALRNATWTWTWSPQTETGTSWATESQGDAAIEAGINSSLGVSATKYSEQQVYVRNLSNNQTLGRFDWVAASGSKRWLVNYITAGENYVRAPNLTNAVYVLEIANKTSAQITSEVSLMINATK